MHAYVDSYGYYQKGPTFSYFGMEQYPFYMAILITDCSSPWNIRFNNSANYTASGSTAGLWKCEGIPAQPQTNIMSIWGNGNFTISEITFLTTCIGCTLSQEDDLLLVDEIPYIDDNPIKKTIIGRFIDWMSNT